MDINSFSLDKEYFGFNHYRRSAKSNLDFMYFTQLEDSSEYKRALRDYNEAVENIKESGLPQTEIDKQLKDEKKRFDLQVAKIKGTQIVEGAGKAASAIDNLFTKAATALGIDTSSQPKSTENAPINVSYENKGSGGSSNTKYWVIAGVVLAAGIGFWIYKNN